MKQTFHTLICAALMTVILMGPTSAQDNPFSNCDVATRALVWAAVDAYGYDPAALGATPEATPAALGPEACARLYADVLRFIFDTKGENLDASALETGTFIVDGEPYEADFIAHLIGGSEVPGPGDEDGSGTAYVAIDTAHSRICWRIDAAGMTLPASMAHIHDGVAGEAGAVVVPLGAPAADGMSAGCARADALALVNIVDKPSAYYVNVHNGDFPNGALRGQLESF
jgi:hypothetical protein